MTDNLSREKRSKVMSCIRSKNTKPELIIRKILWSKGKRYRIHNKTVVGTPDISNKDKKIAIFIDGCFWHGCDKCYKEPRTNITYWRNKICNNKKRRTFVTEQLRSNGWTVMEFWEHQVVREPWNVVNEISGCL